MAGIELDKRRVFGSLHTGRAASSLRSDECPVFRNVQHDVDGFTRKRSGMALIGGVACAPEPTCWHQEPVVHADGAIPNGTYYVRLTHATLAGETDIIRQAGAQAVIAGADNAIRVWHEFHMRKMAVSAFHDLPADTPGLPALPPNATRAYMIELEDGPPLSMLASCPDAFKDFLLYSRAPRLQDQTRYGANPDAADPTYHRIKPLTTIFSFDSYLGNPVFVLAGRVPQIGQTGKIDRDTVDIMMPDRDGLPVQWFNVYISDSFGGADIGHYRKSGVGTSGALPVTCLAYDVDTESSPLDRINRQKLILSVADATDVDPDGCSVPAKTGIRGGLYAAWQTWVTSEREVMQAPGWVDAAPVLGLGGRHAPPRARQEAHPSRAAYIEVRDGQQIQCQTVAFPDIVSGWNLYLAECEPHRILTFEDSARIPGDPDLLHHTTPAADYSTPPIADYNSAPSNFFGMTEFENDNAFPTPPTTDPIARGWPPAYKQVAPFVPFFPFDNPVVDDWRFASSDDADASNRHRFYFPIDTVIDADDLALTTHVVLRFFMRVRPGREATYYPGGATTDPLYWPRVCVWMGGAWVLLDQPSNPSGGFVEHRIPVPFAALSDLFNVANATRRFAVFHVLDQGSVGFDIAEPDLRLYRQIGFGPGDTAAFLDPPIDGAILQVANATGYFITLRQPLADDMWWNTPLRPDNTGSWPLQGFGQNIPRNYGPAGQTTQRIFACGDSLFRMKPRGNFERLWHYEGLDYADVVSTDSQMCAYLWRLFMCNAGLSAWNLRWDQQQTWPMGIKAIEDKGSITSVNEPADGPGVTEDVEIEYYIVACRIVIQQNGYIGRSEPFLFTQTEKVNIKDGIESACRVEGDIRVEPQDTHIELYRNIVDTGFYKRAVVIPITDAIVLPDGRVHIAVDDVFDGTDADLDIAIQFDTGRPPAATMMVFHDGRVHFVPQEDREKDYYTNTTSPDGLPNPEGWFDLNSIDPPLKIAAPITSLSGGDGPLRISTAKGMARVDPGAIGEDGTRAFNCVATPADTGWIGPRAWQEINDVEYGMTIYGPAIRRGDQLEFVGAPCREFVEAAHLDSRSGFASWCVQDPDGRIWFSFTDDPVGSTNGQMILDQQKRGDGGTPYWAEWRFAVHSAFIAGLFDGEPILILGGLDGRVYRYGGRFRTDAGLFIGAQMATRPEPLVASAPSMRAGRPDRVIWSIHGDRQDCVLVDVRKDMEIQRNVNAQPQRIRCTEPPVQPDGSPIPLFGVGEFVPGDGTTFGLPDARMEIERTSRCGTTFSEIQFVVSQELEDMPVGTRREAGFDVAGYALMGEGVGPRRTG